MAFSERVLGMARPMGFSFPGASVLSCGFVLPLGLTYYLM
jgi:hypothetical protein